MRRLIVYLDSACWDCCPNLIFSSRLFRYIEENGHTITDDDILADYIILNSCAVTNRGKQRTLNIIKKYRKRNPTATLLVVGCLADIDREAIQSTKSQAIGFSDSHRLDTHFYSTVHFSEIRPVCNDCLHKQLTAGRHSIAVVPTDNPVKLALLTNHPFLLSLPLIYFSPIIQNRYQSMRDNQDSDLYIQICTGCTGQCHYCLVKKAKGSVHSRNALDIIADIRQRYRPFATVFLVADDCGCYGADIGSSIIQLLDAIHAAFPDLSMKLNYIDPRYLVRFADEFERIFSSMTILMTLIPLQSGSPHVLARMNRQYDIATVMRIIRRLREVSPTTRIHSQFIVGHPGETWKDFMQTISVARIFDNPAPFMYSKNPGTVSASMPDQTSRFTSMLRFVLLLAVQNVVVFFKITGSASSRSLRGGILYKKTRIRRAKGGTKEEIKKKKRKEGSTN